MSMRSLSATMLILAVISTARAAEKPNFLFIIADDCTYRDLGCYGGQAHTPNIDRLASEGMRFNTCFQSAPMCSPTRHNIYTGLYPVKSGAYPNHTYAMPGTKSVVHYLEPLGYRVALIGKRHIAPAEVFEFEYLNGSENPQAEKIEAFIGDCKEQGEPFCLYVCSHEPHTPWNRGDPSQYDAATLKLPPYFVDTENTRLNMTKYLAEITYFDSQVGEALAALDRQGLAGDTLVIVVSEQGSSFPFGKWTCYDTGLQSALIARWPGNIAPGSVSDALVEYGDVLPTYIELAGGTPPAVLDGKSLVPVLTGQADEHKKYVFGEMTTRGIINGSDTFGIRSIRSKRYKYIWNFTPEIKFQNACTKSDIFESWREKAAAGDADAADKVRRYEHRPGEELYDVVNDPYEWNNLADKPEFAAVQAELRRELLAWMEATGDKGQQTELEAFEHQKRALNKQRVAPAKKRRTAKAKSQDES